MAKKTEMFCQNCETVAVPKRVTKGSFIIELFLWLMFLVPGLIYSLWRLTTRHDACPACGATNMLPLTSPKARAKLANSPA